ncbi:MAG: CbtA family protein [Nitrosopumilus sp.]|nr:CbtA family protein [Nitrosopumilus sp.]CAI9831317.1 putative cobalt transporter subunit protein [Nitrosopumilaceae archaeon]MDA7940943.1 CbtA family protein [Nitrosopumilus sp.]MDA7943201.1 CbtA family protein [Nitrosopumilus sp.]MDA7944306.1 CbtA family protein [Nitrosopumilus sp.]
MPLGGGRTQLFFVLAVLGSGAAAGAVQGSVSMALAGPYIEEATFLESRALIDAGDALDTPEFRAEYQEYRDWQRSGMIIAAVVLGMSSAALFGIVYVLWGGSVPGRGPLARSVALALIMWAVLFAVPSIKYPAELPASGDPDTIDERTASYAALMVISGAGAALLWRASGRLRGASKALAPAGYAALMAAAFALLPDAPASAGPDAAGFRAASVAGAAALWAAMGLVFGSVWPRISARAQAA